MRRVVAALLGVILLQGLVPSGGVCLVPGGGSARPAAGPAEARAAHAGLHADLYADPHVDPHAAHRDPADADRRTNPQHAHQSGDHAPTHCLIAMTCSPPGLVATTTPVIEPLLGAGATIAARNEDAPPSRHGAPEPPPPRG